MEVQLFEPENETDSGFQIVEVDTAEGGPGHLHSESLVSQEAAAAYAEPAMEALGGETSAFAGEAAHPEEYLEKERREKEEKEKQKALEAARAATERLLKSRGFQNLSHQGKRY